MTEALRGDLIAYAAHLALTIALCGALVLVMRRSGPVWGPRAATASYLTIVISMVVGLLVLDNRQTTPVPVGFALTCVAIVAVTALGSRLSRLPDVGSLRRASIAPRRLFVARVPRQRQIAAISAALTVAVMLTITVMASPDGTLRRGDGSGQGVVPFTVPDQLVIPALALLLLAVAAWWALREIEARPRVDEPMDTGLRARDASRVMRVTTFGFAHVGMILLFFLGSRMNWVTQVYRGRSELAPHSPWDLYQWVAFGLYVPAALLGVMALAALLGSVGSPAELSAAIGGKQDEHGQRDMGPVSGARTHTRLTGADGKMRR